MSEQLILEVIEAPNGFYLYHNPSGQCQGMGDGVDQEFYNKRLDAFVLVGAAGFTEAWQADVEWDFCTYMEAYFYDLWSLEVYRYITAAGRAWAFVITDKHDEVATGLCARPGKSWLADRCPVEALGSELYRPVAYADLSFDEQAAIAEALKEAE